MTLIPPCCICQPDEKSHGMLLVRDRECPAHGDDAKRKRSGVGSVGLSGYLKRLAPHEGDEA